MMLGLAVGFWISFIAGTAAAHRCRRLDLRVLPRVPRPLIRSDPPGTARAQRLAVLLSPRRTPCAAHTGSRTRRPPLRVAGPVAAEGENGDGCRRRSADASVVAFPPRSERVVGRRTHAEQQGERLRVELHAELDLGAVAPGEPRRQRRGSGRPPSRRARRAPGRLRGPQRGATPVGTTATRRPPGARTRANSGRFLGAKTLRRRSWESSARGSGCQTSRTTPTASGTPLTASRTAAGDRSAARGCGAASAAHERGEVIRRCRSRSRRPGRPARSMHRRTRVGDRRGDRRVRARLEEPRAGGEHLRAVADHPGPRREQGHVAAFVHVDPVPGVAAEDERADRGERDGAETGGETERAAKHSCQAVEGQRCPIGEGMILVVVCARLRSRSA